MRYPAHEGWSSYHAMVDLQIIKEFSETNASDIDLRVGAVTWKVHTKVLCGHSPVFDDAIELGRHERKKDSFRLSLDESASGWAYVLLAMYTSREKDTLRWISCFQSNGATCGPRGILKGVHIAHKYGCDSIARALAVELVDNNLTATEPSFGLHLPFEDMRALLMAVREDPRTFRMLALVMARCASHQVESYKSEGVAGRTSTTNFGLNDPGLDYGQIAALGAQDYLLYHTLREKARQVWLEVMEDSLRKRRRSK